MTIEQIKVGYDNYCYIIYCMVTKKAVVVDPGYDSYKILEFVNKYDLDVEYIINTHYHFDHSKENQLIKDSTSSKIVASELDSKKIAGGVDITVCDNDILTVGENNLRFILTPGHTAGSICIIVNDEAIITGDTLFIGDCGRTDLVGGNLKDMFTTLKNKIYTLPDHLIVYPGHDYGEKPFDSLGNQKCTNKTLVAKNLNEFSKIS